MQTLIKLNKFYWWVIAIFLIGAGWWWSNPKITQNNSQETNNVSQNIAKPAQMIVFGKHRSKDTGVVLGRVTSDDLVMVRAENTGSIAEILVNDGDQVHKGQVLVRFRTNNDLNAVGFTNAKSNLQAAEHASQIATQEAQTAVKIAEQELILAQKAHQQDYSSALTALYRQADGIGVTLETGVTTLSRYLGDARINANLFVSGRREIGASDKIGKNNLRNVTADLVRSLESLVDLDTKKPWLWTVQAQDRLNLSQEIQLALEDFLSLVRGSILSDSFGATERDALEASVIAQQNTIHNSVTALSAALEKQKSASASTSLNINLAQNAVTKAKLSQEQVLAQANNILVAARNQLQLAHTNNENLIIKSPVTGTVTATEVNVFQRVSSGDALVQILPAEATFKAVAELSKMEYQRVNQQGAILQIKETLITDFTISDVLAINSQKFVLSVNLPRSISTQVGASVRIKLPAANNNNLLPLSSVFFEPAGPEVLVYDQSTSVLKRRKITVGSLVVDDWEILQGLEDGDLVVRYINRFYSGDHVTPKIVNN